MKHIAYLTLFLMVFMMLSCARTERFHFIEAEEGTYVMDKKTGKFYPYQLKSEES